MTLIQNIQKLAGVTPDGIYGAATDSAITRQLQTDPAFVKRLQGALGVVPDGNWGSRSSASLRCAQFNVSLNRVNSCKASSFADPADVAAFKRCKAEGFSDQRCFGVGDNGIGAWNNDTSEGSGPQVALPPEFLIAKYGALSQAVHKAIQVTNPANGNKVTAYVGDLMPHIGTEPSGAGIDCNPDVVAALGQTPPMLIPVTWQAL